MAKLVNVFLVSELRSRSLRTMFSVYSCLDNRAGSTFYTYILNNSGSRRLRTKGVSVRKLPLAAVLLASRHSAEVVGILVNPQTTLLASI